LRSVHRFEQKHTGRRGGRWGRVRPAVEPRQADRWRGHPPDRWRHMSDRQRRLPDRRAWAPHL